MDELRCALEMPLPGRYLHDFRLPAATPRDDARTPRPLPEAHFRLARRTREAGTRAESGGGVGAEVKAARSAGAMEKLGRGAKAPSMPTPQQPPVTPRKERRPSMFEKEAVSAKTGHGPPSGLQDSPAFVV